MTATLRLFVGFALLLLLGLPPRCAVAAWRVERAEAGFGLALDAGDRIVQLSAATALAWRPSPALQPVRAALALPLRLRIRDEAPLAKEPSPGPVRTDFDHLDDLGRYVRAVRYEGTTTSWRLGELAGVRLGHGTLVDRYHNQIDPDRAPVGAFAAWDQDLWGGELLVDDVTAAGLAAGRLFVRPLSGQSWTRSLTAGASLAVDRREGLGLTGFDVAVQPWHSGGRALTLYGDVAALGLPGSWAADHGLHAGLALALPGPAGEVVVSAEVRRLRGAYRPGWFDTLYDVERVDRFSLHAGQGKLAASQSRPIDSPGAALAVDVRIPAGIQASAAFDWSRAEGAGARLWLLAPDIAGLQLRALLVRRGVRALSDVLSLDGSLAAASARYAVVGPWFAAVSAAQRFRLAGPDNRQAVGQTELSASVGAEGRF